MTEIYKLARPLLSGVPCEIINGEAQGVQNNMVRDILRGLPQFKGEIVVGNPVDPTCHERTVNFIEDPKVFELFVFWVYDLRTTGPYPLRDRLKIVEPMIIASGPVIQMVDHELIETPQALSDYIKKVVRDNFFPGVVLREPFGTFGTQDETLDKATLSAS